MSRRAMLLAIVALAGCVAPASETAPDAVAFGGIVAESTLTYARGTLPSIGVSADGVVFVTARSDEGRWTVLRSADLGRSWEDVGPTPSRHGSPSAADGAFLAIDRATDTIGLVQSYGRAGGSGAPACAWVTLGEVADVAWSAVESNPAACGVATMDAHARLLLRGDGASGALDVVVCSRSQLPGGGSLGGARCAVAEAGGATPLGARGFGGGAFRAGATFFACQTSPITGALGPDGRIFVAGAPCRTPTVASSDDRGISWRETPLDAPLPEEDVDLPEVAVAVDEGGAAYAMWMQNGLPVIARSDDAGESWSVPVAVAPAGVTAADRPALAAGGSGRVAFAFLGTSIPGGYVDKPVVLDAGARSGSASGPWANATWLAYVGTLVDGEVSIGVAHDPDDPVARGACGRTNCGYAGAMDVTIDASGRAWLAVLDACPGSCARGGDARGGDAFGGAVVAVARVLEGPLLVAP